MRAGGGLHLPVALARHEAAVHHLHRGFRCGARERAGDRRLAGYPARTARHAGERGRPQLFPVALRLWRPDAGGIHAFRESVREPRSARTRGGNRMRLLLLLFLFAGHALAQEWPARPVKFIVSQAPGTSPDITARFLADRLSRLWNQQVVVENRPGGQNVPGAQAAARSAPDGYTFFYATTAAIVSNPYTFKALPYDPARDFVPVAMIAKSPMVVAVNASVPAKSLAELVALDKAQPCRLA